MFLVNFRPHVSWKFGNICTCTLHQYFQTFRHFLPLVICGQYVCTIISKLYGVKFCSLRQLWILLLNDLSDDVHDDGDLYYLDLEDEGSKHGPLTNPSGDINRVTDMSGDLDTVGPAHPV